MSLSSWVQGAFSGSGADLLTSFSSPPMSAKPKLRWWWPHGLVDVEEIKNEIDQMYNGGFGGAEINDVHPSIHVDMDPAGHGWGTGPWLDAVQAAADHAKAKGFQIDIALGPSYPASIPTLTPDDKAAEKEIATGRVVVANGTTYIGPVPAPYKAAGEEVNNATLVAVQAWRMNAASKTTAVPVVLDLGTRVNLWNTALKPTSNITFTPPDNGTWIIISYTMRGTGQKAEAGPHDVHDGAVIDHLSPEGIKAATDYFDKNILSSELKSTFKSIGGSFFEDSIELEYNTLWTPRLRCEFKTRMGYDLFKYLPVIAQENQKQAFSFNDSEVTRGVINDYWDTLGKMYVDYHAGHMTSWSKSLGMKFRAQTYGLSTEAMASSAAVDIPEGESLGFKNMGDYRSLAGAANMKGLKLISNEACAFAASAYTVTWDLILQTLNPIFTSGNNHQVFHGFSYLEAPTAQWPGFAAFTPYSGNIGYSESWGPRIPLWNHVSDIMGYVGRMQTILQRGQPKHDVAFFEQKGYIGAGYNSPWFADSGTMVGWSLNIIGPSLLDLPSATVRDKRLAPDGPGYKLLAFEGDSFANKLPVAKLASAKKIQEFAEAGLPILIVGDWSSVSAYGYGESKYTPQITSIFADILKKSNVVNVATRDDIGTGMTTFAQRGLLPDVQYNSSQIINYHRVDGDLDHFLFVAASPATYAVSTKTKVYAVEADVIIPRRSAKGVPVIMNLWTGEMTPLGQYEELSDTQIKIHISLPAYDSIMITVVPLDTIPVHAISSTGQTIIRENDGLYLRSNTSGTFSTSLSSRKSVTTTVGSIPGAKELKGWTLDVQDWQPTNDPNSTETVYTNHKLQLQTLAAWTNYTELEDVSGIGTYTTKFILDSDWPEDAGAMLGIPDFVGSFRLKVNGKKLPPQPQLDTRFDISPWLKKGENALEIEVATTLLNRLRITQPGVYGVAKRQAYGLVSPIMLLPYRDTKISS